MNKLFFLVFVVFFQVDVLSQSKEDAVQLRIINKLFKRLEDYKINTNQNLIWKYTFTDTSLTTLKKLSLIFDMEELKMEQIGPSKENSKLYFVTLSEEKTYTPETLLERVKYLNEVAHYSKLCNNQASIGAERKANTVILKDYKPVGKYKKVEKE